MKYIVLVIIILIVFVVWRKLSFQKKKQEVLSVDEIEETKISTKSIIRDEELIENVAINNSLFDFELSSITKEKNTLNILITIINHSEQTIRIDLKQALYKSFENKSESKADVTFYGELGMGTNDILLKNTILPNLQVIRNIYFFQSNVEQFHQNDALTIDLLINNEPYQMTKYLHESSIQSVKVIE